jgi:hypothetical protein
MKGPVSLVMFAAVAVSCAAFATAPTLEPESSVQLPRAVIVDSSVPAKVVGQAFFSGATTVNVALKYDQCPVVLQLANGELQSSSGGYFASADCTGTRYFRTNTLNPSPLGTSCGYFLINANREIFQVFSTAGKTSVTFNSRFNAGVCESWSEVWMAYQTVTPKIGDLDDLFTPPFKLQQ